MKAMVKIIIIVVCTLLAVEGITLSVSLLISKTSTPALLKVAVVIPPDEATTEYAISMVESMDSVKSVCEFVYTDEEEAKEGYENGKYEVAVVLPENFFYEVQKGINPPALIYFPKEKSLFLSIFKELIVSGVSFLQTAESGIYASIEAGYVYGSEVDVSQIGNVLAISYFNQILVREKMFTSEMVSALGDMTIAQYYSVAGTVLVLLFTGIGFSFMYSVSSKATEDKLKINGLSKAGCGLVKVISMTVPVYLIGLILYFVLIFLGNRFFEDYFVFQSGIFVGMLILSLAIAVYFELIFEITGSDKSGIFVLIIFNILGSVCSGLIVPQAYLADWTNAIGNVIPMKYAVQFLSEVMKGGIL